MADFEVTMPCVECGGAGLHERRISPDDFRSESCESCDATGAITFIDAACDSISGCREDYPDAILIQSREM
jgi:DnaJ-class molecular chaperone